MSSPTRKPSALLATLAAGAALSACPALALAAGGEDAPGVIPTFNQGLISGLAALLVFGIVFAILATQVWPRILKGLRDREEKIRTEIESAEMARQQAKDALEQYQRSLAEARAEAAKMIEQTKAQQAALAAELRAKADTEVAQMKERALRDIEAAKRAAVTEIYAGAGELASLMASKILRRQVNPGDTQQLVDESLSQLAATRN
ncbi:MAG: F0F1 ATP synthase subunit B [Phycisphaeraceae bacterium]|nr:F0F1 ATP synthase subunit B [Phycisphaeraceae bacterium]